MEWKLPVANETGNALGCIFNIRMKRRRYFEYDSQNNLKEYSETFNRILYPHWNQITLRPMTTQIDTSDSNFTFL